MRPQPPAELPDWAAAVIPLCVLILLVIAVVSLGAYGGGETG
jgi:hypothetical protein